MATRAAPPGICIRTGLAQRPVLTAAPAAALAELPDASV
jgi:hypothetical protein